MVDYRMFISDRVPEDLTSIFHGVMGLAGSSRCG